MGKASRFYDLRVETAEFCLLRLFFEQALCQPPSNLRDLDSVLLPGVKNVRFAGTDNLGNAGETMESGRIEQPIAITLELRTLVAHTIAV